MTAHTPTAQRTRGLGVAARAGVLLVVVAVLGSCGIADKKHDAGLIRRAVVDLAAQGTATVRQTVQIKVISVSQVAQAATAGSGQRKGTVTPKVTSTYSLDYGHHLMMATIPSASPEQPADPFQIFNEGTLYQRRLRAAKGTRPWLKLEIGALYEERKRNNDSAFGNDLLNPAWIVDLMRGSLEGSIKRAGTETLDGVATTHYKVNFDWQRSLKGAPEARKRAVQTALTMMGVPSRVVRGEVWLGADGLPRRMAVKIRQSRKTEETIEWQFTLDFSDIGHPVAINLPLTKDISVVTSAAAIAQAALSGRPGSPTSAGAP